MKIGIFGTAPESTGLPKGTKLSSVTKEFKNIPEYQEALFRADKFIVNDKEIPLELKTKLIKTKHDIAKYEKEHGLVLFFGY